MPSNAGSRTDSVGKDQEIDRAFLRWFEARLATTRPVTSDDVTDYLIALALC